MDQQVLIIGAGPAGAVAAKLLADWGHRVLVVQRPGGDPERLGESIPPSANKLLAEIGASDAVSEAGFLPWRGNTVWWADEPARVETFADQASGYQVLRRDFDSVLRRLAVHAGAEIREGRVTDADVASAPIVIDASGRSGVLARRRRLRVEGAGPRTIAVTGTWRSAGDWPGVDDASHTLVASYTDGWAWSVPTGPGLRQVSVMIDPARTSLARGGASREVYLAEVAKARPFTSMLAGAGLVDGPWGADASVYSAQRYAGAGFVLVGDAGSAIDPLSSFGVKKALASAWLAAIVVHTALSKPAMADHALAFYDRREQDVFAAAQRQAARFAGDAAARLASPYWTTRADSMVDAGIEPDVGALVADANVQRAFADLRERPSIRLTTGRDVRVEPRAAVRGHEIVMEPQIVAPTWPHGIRYLRNVDLVQLLDMAPRHNDVGDVCAAVLRSTSGAALPDILGALSVLVATGTLRHRQP
ncbi:MAG TPA: FAD-dependent monooxygenase [Vicinamibacterales bacterium]|nr:FAD-dependent monooxygenase [Vicinamibacterales bacterium]